MLMTKVLGVAEIDLGVAKICDQDMPGSYNSYYYNTEG